jgi:predicted transcriptional regulator
MKLLLYCTKGKLSLRKSIKDKDYYLDNGSKFNIIPKEDYKLNGKIVAECDFKVEKINVLDCTFRTFNLVEKEILNKSCLTYKELFEYLKNRDNPRGYAIHIKNLQIFDKPKELSNYLTRAKEMNMLYGSSWVCESIDKAPQNMMYAQDENQNGQYILISIRPEWLCKILNGEKTIEVRKKVLKEMLE